MKKGVKTGAKFLSVLLAVLVMLQVMPLSSFAASEAPEAAAVSEAEAAPEAENDGERTDLEFLPQGYLDGCIVLKSKKL